MRHGEGIVMVIVQCGQVRPGYRGVQGTTAAAVASNGVVQVLDRESLCSKAVSLSTGAVDHSKRTWDDRQS